jgi:hypothetical protein
MLNVLLLWYAIRRTYIGRAARRVSNNDLVRTLTSFTIALVLLLSACGQQHTQATGTASSSSTATPTQTPVAAPPTASGPRTEAWADLEVGACLANIPQVDIGEVTATVVDCATPHQAEVFARAAMWVDSTVPDIANRACVAEFPKYTGKSIDSSHYAVSYLIDAEQDRTGNDPNAPGTAICLLLDANGAELTGSARG